MKKSKTTYGTLHTHAQSILKNKGLRKISSSRDNKLWKESIKWVDKFLDGKNKCHSDSDGDCDWKKCPQLLDYQTICPLYVEPEEY